MMAQLRSATALVAGLIGTALFVASPMSCLSEEDFSVDVLREGCKAALCEVKSGKGQVVIRTCKANAGAESDFKSTCELAFAGEKYRLSEQREVMRNDPLPGRDPKAMIPVGSVSRREIAVDHQTVMVLSENRATVGDLSTGNRLVEAAYAHCMMDFNLSWLTATGKGLVDIGAVEQTFFGTHYLGANLSVRGRDIVDGSECVCLELIARGSSQSAADRIIRYWIDPNRGFAIPRVRAFYDGGPYTEQTLSNETNVKFRDYGSGIWFPAEVTMDYYKLDKAGSPYRYMHKTITYGADFELNVDLTDESLSLALPPDTSVYDANLDATYTVP